MIVEVEVFLEMKLVEEEEQIILLEEMKVEKEVEVEKSAEEAEVPFAEAVAHRLEEIVLLFEIIVIRVE